jgi:CHAP domain
MPSSTPNTYTAGNCTWYVKDQLSWVPNLWGNAAEWWGRAQQSGFPTSSSPQVGAIAVWGPGIDPPQGFGHVAVVRAVQPDGSFTVSEMNWQGLGKIDTRTVKDRGNVLGFILAPGSSASSSTGSSGGSDPFGISSAILGSVASLQSGAQIAGGTSLVLAGLVLAVVIVAAPRALRFLKK